MPLVRFYVVRIDLVRRKSLVGRAHVPASLSPQLETTREYLVTKALGREYIPHHQDMVMLALSGCFRCVGLEPVKFRFFPPIRIRAGTPQVQAVQTVRTHAPCAQSTVLDSRCSPLEGQ